MLSLRRIFVTALALLIATGSASAALVTATAPVLNVPVGEPFAPDFTKPLGPEWKIVKGAWSATNGMLRGDELAEDKHSAVLWHPGKIEALIITCEFRLGETRTLYIGFDEKRHVGRLVIHTNSIGLYEDSPVPNPKPGVKQASKPLATYVTKLKPDEWYPLTLEIRGDEMVALVNGIQLKAKHPFLATPKERYWFAVNGKDLRLRNLKVWNAKPNPNWPDRAGQFNN